MDITNPVLFEVLAERPRLRASRRQFAVAHAFSRSAFSRTAFPLPRGALVGGSNRRPFPRDGSGSPSGGTSPQPGELEGAGWREFVGLLATAGVLALALLV